MSIKFKDLEDDQKFTALYHSKTEYIKRKRQVRCGWAHNAEKILDRFGREDGHFFADSDLVVVKNV